MFWMFWAVKEAMRQLSSNGSVKASEAQKICEDEAWHERETLRPQLRIKTLQKGSADIICRPHCSMRLWQMFFLCRRLHGFGGRRLARASCGHFSEAWGHGAATCWIMENLDVISKRKRLSSDLEWKILSCSMHFGSLQTQVGRTACARKRACSWTRRRDTLRSWKTQHLCMRKTQL